MDVSIILHISNNAEVLMGNEYFGTTKINLAWNKKQYIFFGLSGEFKKNDIKWKSLSILDLYNPYYNKDQRIYNFSNKYVFMGGITNKKLSRIFVAKVKVYVFKICETVIFNNYNRKQIKRNPWIGLTSILLNSNLYNI